MEEAWFECLLNGGVSRLLGNTGSFYTIELRIYNQAIVLAI